LTVVSIARSLIAAAALTLAMLPKAVFAQRNDADGAALFARSGCSACHGADGRGSSLAPGIADASLELSRFTASVRAPRGTMPAYAASVLTDDDVAAIRAHLAGLAPQPRPTGDAQAGGQRFESAGCYSCHSNQGQGVLHGPRIAPAPIRWERFTWYVRHPVGQMPPYSDVVLSDADLADIYAFLESRPRPQPLEQLPLLAP